MQKRIAFLLCAAAVSHVAATAGPLFSLDPGNGQLQGSPNGTVGWGFIVNPNALNWISLTGSAVQNLSPTLVGDYVDLIGATGGPVNFVLPPGITPWVQAFDTGLGTGAGSFLIASGAAIGSTETGEIVVFYDEFSDDPNTCGSCYLDSNSSAAPFRIDVVAAATAPEPGTGVLLALLALAMALHFFTASGPKGPSVLRRANSTLKSDCLNEDKA